jgi:hypothetical protein
MTHQHLCCAGCTCWIPVKPEELVKSFLENVISVLYPGLVGESGSANVARPHALLDALFRLPGTQCICNSVVVTVCEVSGVRKWGNPGE